MIKISRKVSVIVILSVMVALIIGFGGLMKITQTMSSNYDSNNYSIDVQKEDMKIRMEDYKNQIAEIKEIKGTASEVELLSLEEEERGLQNQLEMLQFAIDNDILIDSNSYRANATYILFSNKEMVNRLSTVSISNLEPNLTEEQKMQKEDALSNISRLEKIIKNKDFEDYISFMNGEINKNIIFSDEEKKIYLESNALRLKYNLTGEVVNGVSNNVNAESMISQIENGKLSLMYDVDYYSQVQKPLTADMRESIKNDIAVTEYKLGKVNVNNTSTGGLVSVVISGMLGLGIFMVVILIMILAGGSVSSEMSTGSIKSLIISPTKRWKIFTAKYFSLLTIGIIAALIAYIFSVIVYGIFFGFNSGESYIYASNGVAHEINFYFYQLARMFTDFIVVVVYMTFALMLSTITRNTAASVAIAIGVYFVGSTANTILMQFTKGDWRKFIPFNNLDFTSKIFSNDSLSQVSNSMSGAVNNSLTFSLIYTSILVICMVYIGLDSFNRRDIK